jgi:lipopolysaccharide/colanic/teichoic acid biosynthesis glycosyltransferase
MEAGRPLQLAFQPIDHTDAGDVTVVLPRRPWYSYNSTLKRALDMVVAALVLVCTLPIWLAIIVAIRFDSAGPAIFVQERVGLRGRRFRFYKFRSMTNGADRMKAGLRHLSEVDGPVFKIRTDPRVTRVGRFLRQTSLDELPQLINVLRGEMSLVGPRPPVPEEVAQYRPSDMIRLAVKPGLTCWWQVRGRSSLDFDTWMAFDREYVYGVSFWVDVAILVRTAWAVVSCRGAY